MSFWISDVTNGDTNDQAHFGVRVRVRVEDAMVEEECVLFPDAVYDDPREHAKLKDIYKLDMEILTSVINFRKAVHGFFTNESISYPIFAKTKKGGAGASDVESIYGKKAFSPPLV